MRSKTRVGSQVALLALVSAGCGSSDPPGARAGLAPTAEERLGSWERARPDEPVPVAVGFHDLVPDSIVTNLLQRWNLRPYSALVYLPGIGSAGRTGGGPEDASGDVILQARADAVQQLQHLICRTPGRARAMLASGLEDAPDQLLRSVISQFRFAREEQDTVATEPIIYGVYATGDPADVRRLLDSLPEIVRSVEPGMVVRRPDDREIVALPQPENPSYEQPRDHPSTQALDRAGLTEALRELSDSTFGGCEELPARERRRSL